MLHSYPSSCWHYHSKINLLTGGKKTPQLHQISDPTLSQSFIFLDSLYVVISHLPRVRESNIYSTCKSGNVTFREPGFLFFFFSIPGFRGNKNSKTWRKINNSSS